MKSIKVIFSGVCHHNDVIEIIYDNNMSLQLISLTATTGTTSLGKFSTSLGPQNDQANKFKTGLDAVLSVDFVSNISTTYLVGDSVTITTTNPEISFLEGTSNNTDVDFLIFDTEIINAVNDIKVRSPHLLITTGATPTTFTDVNYIIKQYEGPITNAFSAPTSYVKSKSKIVPTQNNVYINISNLVREDLTADIDYFQDTDFTVARNLSLNESKWVYVETETSYLGTGVTSGVTYFYVTDGYIEPNEEQGIPNILMTGNKRYLYRGSHERLYFKTDGLTGLTMSSPSMGVTSISFSGDTNMNYGYVKSVKINTPISDNYIDYTFSYNGSNPKYNVRFYFYDECKYENYDLVFKNKHGVMESISLSKKTSKTLSVDGTDYLRSIVDFNGDYNINRHTAKQYNVTGTEEWTLNTDFLPEYMNAPIKEAMLSEEMWLIDSDGNIIPVVRKDQNIQFKTSLNDKLIQYTITVKLSHRTVKNII